MRCASLGGALAVRVAASNQVPSLVGVMVIDVVEGTAMASLGHMHAILEKRPRRFRSFKDAIHWALHSGTVRNADAADVSIPSQLQQLDDGSLTWRTDLASSAPYWKGGVTVIALQAVANSTSCLTASWYLLCLLRLVRGTVRPVLVTLSREDPRPCR